MKKIVFISFAFILLIGCKPKTTATSIFDFEVTVSRIESHKVWLDIIPQDEFIRYYLDWMPVSEWNALYPTDQAYKDELASNLTLYTEDQYKRVTEEGSFLSTLFVTPNTEYYILITSLNADRKPVDIRKTSFQSKEERISSFSLLANDITMLNSVISISPQNTTDTYFWDYELKKNIDRDWGGSHSVWFYYDVEYYYQMDFLDPVPEKGLLSRGYSYEDCYKYYPQAEIEVGDTICLVAVGYDASGETSPAYMPFWIIWGGKESASTVVEADKDGYESVFRGEPTSPKRNTAKASSLSQSCSQKSLFGHTNRYIPRHIRSAKH